MRKKILFYDKEIKLAYPQYAINLLKELEYRGYDIYVLYDRPKQESKETLSGVRLDEVYCDFKSKRINSWDDVYSTVSLYRPNLYLSSLALMGFERLLLEYIHSIGVLIFEMDTIASEILKYNYDYRYMSVNRNFFHLLKVFFARFCEKMRIENFISNKIHGMNLFAKPTSLISDFISIRGVWFQKLLTINNMIGYSSDIFPVAGSIQLDRLCNEISNKEVLFKDLDYDINKKTILLLPTVSWLKNKKDNKFFKNILDYLISKGNYNIAIQPHPGDRIKNPDRFSKLEHLVINPLNFYPILQHCDLVICPRSSVFFETAITRKPLFFASHHMNNIEMPVITDSYKIASFVSVNNFETKLEDVISGREKFDYDNFIKYFCHSDDGKSYLRIANIIEEIVN